VYDPLRVGGEIWGNLTFMAVQNFVAAPALSAAQKPFVTSAVLLDQCCTAVAGLLRGE
jgi:hypothetical protein